jgi:spermidine/putrescine-binding protein
LNSEHLDRLYRKALQGLMANEREGWRFLDYLYDEASLVMNSENYPSPLAQWSDLNDEEKLALVQIEEDWQYFDKAMHAAGMR